MKNIYWFITQSLILDYRLFFVSRWSIFKKIQFYFTKYFILLSRPFKKFKLGDDFANLYGERVYYDSPFGIAGYQSILARHQYLIKLAEIKNLSTVIDVGANVGFFSKLIRELYPHAAIYSIEPVPETYKCLELNFRDDKKTKTINLALSDKEGMAKMSFNPNQSSVSHFDNKGKIEVVVGTLDNFIVKNNVKSVDLLKIDVEGFEHLVLKGAIKTLPKTKYLFIEITVEDNKNYTMSSLMSQLYSPEFNFQIVGFRNYDDTSIGKMPIMDCLLQNIKFQ